jgi:signal peptide peptidase SppA
MSAKTSIKTTLSRLSGKKPPVVAVLRLHGVIASGSRFGSALNLASLAGAIEAAFDVKGAKAVALSINSPGGSPVQSTLIHDRIRALAEKKSLPVFAFAEDVAASGGYMLACAADRIYADASSIVGSIGVISAGFGFPELMEKLGIERRVITAGKNKSTLDPFRPVNDDDIARVVAIQKDVHEAFTKLVMQRREGRLKFGDVNLFTGEFWSGSQAERYGLIDGITDLRSEMVKRYGEDVKLRVIAQERAWWRRTPRFDEQQLQQRPLNWADELFESFETRALWTRFGL